MKLKKLNGLKVVFTSSNMTSVATERGLSIFQLHIPSQAIKKDEYVSTKVCYICYQLNSHISSDCPKRDQGYKICSNCSSTDHTWRDCNSDIKKCINCQGDHNTMAPSCPKKRIQKNHPQNNAPPAINMRSYSEVVCAPDYTEIISKSISCVIMSLFSDHNDISYEDRLNKLLTLNGLSPMIVGDMNFDLAATRHRLPIVPNESHSLSVNDTIYPSNPITSPGTTTKITNQLMNNKVDVSHTMAMSDEPPSSSSLCNTKPPLKPQLSNSGASELSIYIKRGSSLVSSVASLFSEYDKGNVIFMDANGLIMNKNDIPALKKGHYSKLKKSFIFVDKDVFGFLQKSSSRILRSQGLAK